MGSLSKVLIEKINKADWWHVVPDDPRAYTKRGQFLASTFLQAAFYGRPDDAWYKVKISKPVFGFSERQILHKLFGREDSTRLLTEFLNSKKSSSYRARITLDAKMCKKAKALGHDVIVLVGRNGKKSLQQRRKPNSIELNLLYPSTTVRVDLFSN